MNPATARGPSRKGLLGNSCVENKGFMVQETAKNLVSGRVPRGPSGKGLLGNSGIGNKGLMVRETAKNLVSGRASRGALKTAMIREVHPPVLSFTWRGD